MGLGTRPGRPTRREQPWEQPVLSPSVGRSRSTNVPCDGGRADGRHVVGPRRLADRGPRHLPRSRLPVPGVVARRRWHGVVGRWRCGTHRSAAAVLDGPNRDLRHPGALGHRHSCTQDRSLRSELCPGEQRRCRANRAAVASAAWTVSGMYAGCVHERHGPLESVGGRHEDECHMDAVARARDLHVVAGDGHRGARELNRQAAAGPRHPEPPPQLEVRWTSKRRVLPAPSVNQRRRDAAGRSRRCLDCRRRVSSGSEVADEPLGGERKPGGVKSGTLGDVPMSGDDGDLSNASATEVPPRGRSRSAPRDDHSSSSSTAKSSTKAVSPPASITGGVKMIAAKRYPGRHHAHRSPPAM